MNDKRRQLLRRASAYLDDAERLVSSALDEEQDSLDAIPEQFECTDRYEKMEEAIELLEDAIENINVAREKVDDAAA